MMSAEDELDLNEEIAAMSLTSSDPGTISTPTKSSMSLDETEGKAVGECSSRNSINVPSLTTDKTTATENEGNAEHLRNSSGTHTPVELAAPQQNAASVKLLFKGDDKDFLSSTSIPPPLMSANKLFSGNASDDFLHTSELSTQSSHNSSFNIVNKHSLNSSTTSQEVISKSITDNNSTKTNLMPSFGPSHMHTTFSPTKDTLHSPPVLNVPPQANINTTSYISSIGTPPISSTIDSYKQPRSISSPYVSGNFNTHNIQGLNFNNDIGPQQTPNISPPFTPYTNAQIPTPIPHNQTSQFDPNSQTTASFQPSIPPSMFQTSATQPKMSIQPKHQVNSPNTQQAGLFIPSIYSSQQNKLPTMTTSATSTFFVPTQSTESTISPNNGDSFKPTTCNSLSNGFPATQNNNYSNPKSSPQDYNLDFPNSYNIDTDAIQGGMTGKDGGIWNWIKNTLNRDIKSQIKNATDSVLTTLDPGMEDYLKGCTCIAVASQDISTVHGIRQGFNKVFAVVDVKGQSIPQGSPILPVGFQAAVTSVNETLDYCTNVRFGFNSPCHIVATKAFLAELTPNQWSVMICFGLKDTQNNLTVHSFSQPITISAEVMQVLYNRTGQHITTEQNSGYNVSIEEIIKMHRPYTNDEDWCTALTGGLPLFQIIFSASICLASSFKEQSEKQSTMYQQQQQDFSYQQNGLSLSQPPPPQQYSSNNSFAF